MKEKSSEIESPQPCTKKKSVEYTVIIGNHLYHRIDKHVRLLKNLKINSSKQKWVLEAIEEKLKIDVALEANLGDRLLHVKCDIELWNEIQKKIELLKAFRRSISKKQWIEEAIYDKLEREEQKSKELLKNMLKATSEASEISSN